MAVHTGRTAAIVGFPQADVHLYNAAAVCAHGRVAGVYRKHLLPNYAVFDEQRYFTPAPTDGPLFDIGGVRVGVTICEDAWSPTGPVLTEAAAGAGLVVNINASPYYAGRLREREAMLADRAVEASTPILFVNLVGGQDELVFDGASVLVDESGAVIARARQFEEDLLVVDLDLPAGGALAARPPARADAAHPARIPGQRGPAGGRAAGLPGRGAPPAGPGGV